MNDEPGQHETIWRTSDAQLTDLWNLVVRANLRDFGCSHMDGRPVHLGPPWLRDHVHEMKGFKYFCEDLKSGLEFFFRHRLPDGQFPDFFVPIGDQHQDFVHPDFEVEDPRENRVFIRIPVEADLEYLAVEGVYQAWQATNDTDWMAVQLPILREGLRHLTSHKWRWSGQYKLVQRPFTPDTWDFTNFYDPDDAFKTNCEIRRLDDSTPLCLFHGDNSGLYAACRMLARLCAAAGEKDADSWEAFAGELRQRANKLLWGETFYVHQLHLDPALAAQHEERQRLSLSNTYDINRGLPDHDMAVAIIDAYRERLQERNDTYMAEWFTIEPPYEPRFAWYVPGEYVNGGLFGAVGGELAKAAFAHGREAYGADLLRRYHTFVRQHGRIGFMYWPDGREYGGGPAGWCAAAFVSAMMEGLAGVVDRSSGFEEVLLSPRFAAAGVESALIRAVYPASGRFFEYEYQAKQGAIHVRCSGDGSRLTIHLLLPEGCVVREARWRGRRIDFQLTQVEKSRYVDVHPDALNGDLWILLGQR